MIANAGICGQPFISVVDSKFKFKQLPIQPKIQLFRQATLDQWERVFNINVKGTFLCYKYAGIQMVAQGKGGRIVGASSMVGKRGVFGCLLIY